MLIFNGGYTTDNITLNVLSALFSIFYGRSESRTAHFNVRGGGW